MTVAPVHHKVLASNLAETLSWIHSQNLPLILSSLGEKDGAVYLNLADEQGRVVKITSEGWEVLGKSPIKFVVPRGSQSLPVPESGGSIDDLRPFVNVEDETGWKLFVSSIIAAFKPTGPYPICVLQGEQGSSKSTAMRIKRALSGAQLDRVNKEFADLLDGGSFEQRGPLPEEFDEPALKDLPRLTFPFNRRSAGRQRQLIDHLNSL